MTTMLRRTLPLALALAGAGLTATLSAGPANAGVGDYFYDGKSPITTGCNNDAVTIDDQPVGGGARILLRYSPACRAVWAHISGAARPIAGQQAGGSALIYREQDGAGIRCNAGNDGSCFTAMLNDAGFTSHATGTNDVGFTIYRATTISY